MLCQLFLIFIIIFSISTSALSGSDVKRNQVSEPRVSYLIEDQQGNIIIEKNSKKKFNPASTLKLLTSLVALKRLGEDYKFKTEFYLDAQNNLKIKGYGDPFLISEVWNRLAEKIANKIKIINNILIDDSFFASPIKIPGIGNSLNPYDAPVGALCVNFNTIYIKKIKDKFISGEHQTPLIPFAQNQIKKMHIKDTGRYIISHRIRVAETYAGELFKYFLKIHGVYIKGKVGFNTTNPEDKLIYVYYSEYPLKEIIKKMLKYSNNFIANQITLVLGAEVYGAPATLEKGVNMIKKYAKKRLGLKDITVVEGSGISRKNFVSCYDMMIILREFSPYMSLLRKEVYIYYKTGTLRGINTRAGYVVKKNNRYTFVFFYKGNPQTAECILNYIFHKASLSPQGIHSDY